MQIRQVEDKISTCVNGSQQALIGQVGEVIAASVLQKAGVCDVHYLRGAT